jgi:hypothetical protein
MLYGIERGGYWGIKGKEIYMKENMRVVDERDDLEERIEVGKLKEEVASSLGSGLLPLAIESLAGSSDSQVDILLGTLADGGDDLLGGGVDNLKLSLVDTLNPLAADEEANGLLVSTSNGSGQLDGESHCV